MVVALHSPWPSQKSPVCTPSLQDLTPPHSCVASGYTQAPSPSHAPPHGPSPHVSLVPPAIGVQTPSLPGITQATQSPSQAVSQQTPSAQKPLPHSSAASHSAPSAFLP